MSPRAQQVLALARKEAVRLNHEFLGTEHLLLGIIALAQGGAIDVLRKHSVDLDSMRQGVERVALLPPTQKISGNIPYTPRVKKVLDLASEAAVTLAHPYVCTEDLLLGILEEGEGLAARVLKGECHF